MAGHWCQSTSNLDLFIAMNDQDWNRYGYSLKLGHVSTNKIELVMIYIYVKEALEIPVSIFYIVLLMFYGWLQGKLEMWVDIFPKDSAKLPMAADITPRLPVRYMSFYACKFINYFSW